MPKIDQVGPPKLVVAAVLDSTGAAIAPDSWPRTFTYNADGTLNYEQVTDGTSTWRKTYGYAAGKVSSESDWVKQ